MPSYSKRSIANLRTCHRDLVAVFTQVIPYFDHTILEGHRSVERQQKLFNTFKNGSRVTQIDGVNRLGKHNYSPSLAVDAAPYPINWKDVDRFCFFAGFVMGTARAMYNAKDIDHLIRWGGDWDRDTELTDETFRDFVHFELYKP